MSIETRRRASLPLIISQLVSKRCNDAIDPGQGTRQQSEWGLKPSCDGEQDQDDHAHDDSQIQAVLDLWTIVIYSWL